MAGLDSVVRVATDYIGARDNFLARYRLRNTGVIGKSGSQGGPLAFSALVTEHAVTLASILPPMSQDQWEGLHELSGSYLAHIRMNIQRDSK